MNKAKPVTRANRREFLALSLALTGAGALVLTGCGGGSSSFTSAGGGGGREALGLTRLTVQADHGTAAGTLPSYTDLTLATPWEVAAADGAGRASLTGTSDGSTLAFAADSSGHVLYYGWVSPARSALSAATTAEVLLYFAMGVYALPESVQEQVRDIIASSDSVRSTLTPVVQQFLVSQPARLSGDTTALMAAVAAEAGKLLAEVRDPSVRSRALQFVNPGERSGLETVSAPEPNTIFVQNSRLRRAVMIVNRIGYVKDDGSTVDETTTPVQLSLAPVPVPKAFNTFANTVSGWIEAVYGNQKFADGSTNAGFFSSVSDKVVLPLAPTGATKTNYRVVVLQAGSLPGNEAIFAGLLPKQQEYLRGVNLNNILLRALLEDMLAPYLFAFISKKLAGDSALLMSAAATLLTTLQTAVPGVVERVAAGQMTPWDAFIAITKALTIDPGTGVASSALRKLLGVLVEAAAVRYGDIRGSIALEILTNGAKTNGGRVVPGVAQAMAILATADKALDYGNKTRLITDCLSSSEVEVWDITVVPSKITLSPDKASVSAGSEVTFTAKILDADSGASLITYHWSLAGKGTLINPESGLTGTSIDSSVASVKYKAASDAAGGDTATLTVEGFVGGVNDPKRRSVGKATAPITIGDTHVATAFQYADIPGMIFVSAGVSYSYVSVPTSSTQKGSGTIVYTVNGTDAVIANFTFPIGSARLISPNNHVGGLSFGIVKTLIPGYVFPDGGVGSGLIWYGDEVRFTMISELFYEDYRGDGTDQVSVDAQVKNRTSHWKITVSYDYH